MSTPRFDPQVYLDTYKDLTDWWADGSKQGEAGGRGIYYKEQGRDTTGWEKNWVRDMNRLYGTSHTDMGQFGRDEYARAHYDLYGKAEGRLNKDVYKNAISKANAKTAQQNQDDYFNVDRFNSLLTELEASKGRQVRQKAVEGRRDTFATGLASMMSNF